MKAKYAWAALWILPLPLLAQAPTVITMDQEPHHHLALKNEVVKVFQVDLQPRDSFLMHSHDTDDVAVVVANATTVTVSPGKADVLQISKTGEVHFARSGRVHLVRNIGQTPYRIVSIDLLRPQTGARNLCATQVPDQPINCPAAPPSDVNAPRIDQPQFETDQTRVTVTRIRPKQNAALGETDRDALIVAIDESVVAAAAGKGPGTVLHPGDFVWIGQGETARVFQNDSDKEARVVTVAFKP
jgi:quercetin dioxygenase-like cupin family protein